MSFREWLEKWFKNSNKPVAALALIKGSAIALEEAVRDIVKLDKTYTKESALKAVLDEYANRQKK